MSRLLVLLLIPAAAVAGACTKKTLDATNPQTIIISPRTVIIRAAQAVDFTVTATNVSDPTSYTCTLSNNAIGAVTRTAAGCHLVVNTPAVAGSLYARIGLLTDSAVLTVTSVR